MMPISSVAARAVAAGLLLAATIAGSASPADAGTNSWTTVSGESVAGQNFILKSVDAPAAGDVWAVGYHWEFFGGALEFRTLAEHYEGGRFVIVPTPDRELGTAADMLTDVSGTSGSDVWAVGTSRPTGVPAQSLVEHWDGSAWTIVASANPGVHGTDLEAVAALAADDAWAVGARTDGFYQVPSAQHWDGTAWTAVTVPNPSGCSGHSYLTDVSAVTSGDVWATGWCGSGGNTPEQGFVTHWNGTRWRIAAGFGVFAPRSELYGISAKRRSVWVVGYTQDSVALAAHWDGTAWTQEPVDAPQQSASLLAVVARSGGTAWSVGAGTSPQPPFAGPTSVRFAGGHGVPKAVPVSFGTLRGIAHDPAGTLWAVGQQLPGQNDIPLIVSRPE